MHCTWHRRRRRQKKRQKSSLFGAQSSFNFMPFYRHLRPDDLKKWTNRQMDTWRNGSFRKLDDLPPTQNGCFFPKTFLQIILAAKWLVQHSSTSTSPKQPGRPLPSLLSNSSSMAQGIKILYPGNNIKKILQYSSAADGLVPRQRGRPEKRPGGWGQKPSARRSRQPPRRSSWPRRRRRLQRPRGPRTENRGRTG